MRPHSEQGARTILLLFVDPEVGTESDGDLDVLLTSSSAMSGAMACVPTSAETDDARRT